MPRIDGQRLLADLKRLRSIGAEGTGVVRPALSPMDIQARRWLCDEYAKCDLDASMDGLGNVLGRSRNRGKALLIGSHSDTQPTGGWLDGAMGVLYGLEVVRAFTEDPDTRDLAVDAVAWQDEESRFLGCMGSRSYCGEITPEMLAVARDKDGVMLSDAIEAAGLTNRPYFKADPKRHIGFLEAHIEQGPILEDEGLKIGIVSSIVGLRGNVFTFHGRQNHAGTTSMARRQDAATALYEMAHAINCEFPKVAGERSVWTMGRAVIMPGAPSIVPGYAELELQYRDQSTRVLDTMSAVVEGVIDKVNGLGGASVAMRSSAIRIEPAEMDERLKGHIRTAAERNAAGSWMDMPSGAFHDAGILSSVMPAAMLFIPSIGGMSHDFAEDSHHEDIVLGCQVLADAAAAILKESLAL